MMYTDAKRSAPFCRVACKAQSAQSSRADCVARGMCGISKSKCATPSNCGADAQGRVSMCPGSSPEARLEDMSRPSCSFGCGEGGQLEGFPLASVYAPVQVWGKLYDEDKALERGTLFEELDLPFLGDSRCSGGKRGNCCD